MALLREIGHIVVVLGTLAPLTEGLGGHVPKSSPDHRSASFPNSSSSDAQSGGQASNYGQPRSSNGNPPPMSASSHRVPLVPRELEKAQFDPRFGLRPQMVATLAVLSGLFACVVALLLWKQITTYKQRLRRQSSSCSIGHGEVRCSCCSCSEKRPEAQVHVLSRRRRCGKEGCDLMTCDCAAGLDEELRGRGLPDVALKGIILGRRRPLGAASTGQEAFRVPDDVDDDDAVAEAAAAALCGGDALYLTEDVHGNMVVANRSANDLGVPPATIEVVHVNIVQVVHHCNGNDSSVCVREGCDLKVGRIREKDAKPVPGGHEAKKGILSIPRLRRPRSSPPPSPPGSARSTTTSCLSPTTTLDEDCLTESTCNEDKAATVPLLSRKSLEQDQETCKGDA